MKFSNDTCTCARNLLKQCAALKGWTKALLQMSPTNLSAQWIPTLYRKARYNADFDVGGHHGQHMPHENGGQHGIAPRDPVGCLAWASSCSVLLKSTNDKHNGTHKHNAQASQYKCHGTLFWNQTQTCFPQHFFSKEEVCREQLKTTAYSLKHNGIPGCVLQFPWRCALDTAAKLDGHKAHSHLVRLQLLLEFSATVAPISATVSAFSEQGSHSKVHLSRRLHRHAQQLRLTTKELQQRNKRYYHNI